MIKKFTLLLVMLLGMGVSINAKSTVTTLWEDTYDGVIPIAASSLSAGKTLTIYMSWKSDAGCSLGISAQYTDADGLKTDGVLPSLKEIWPWQNNGTASKSFELSTADMEKITSSGSLYIASADAEKMTISKITLTETFTPTSVSDNLLDKDWAGSATPKILSAINSVKMGDELQFTVSIESAYTWIQFKLTDKNGDVDQFTGSGSEYQGNGDGLTTFTFGFTISTPNDLWMIMNSGFGVKKTYEDGAFILKEVKLLSYADSYDYTIDIEMNSDGYMTYSNSMNLDFSGTGLTPYYASSAKVGTVTLTSTTTTWNWQGYILRGPAGPHHPKVVADANASYPSGNLLKGNVGESTVKASESGDTNFRYILAKKKEGAADIGFYKLTSDHTLAANKAYLETNSDLTPTDSGNAPALKLIFGGEGEGTTGINTVSKNPVVEDGVYYNLQGVAVKNPSKGLYILNGKKVIVK